MEATRTKAVARTGAGTLRLIEETLKPPKRGQVLIEVHRSLVSPGTELGGGWAALARERENPQPMDTPRPIGYSNAGVVSAVGKGVTTVKPGDRVAAIGAGYARHAEHALVPQNLVFRLPDAVSFDDGSFAMLAATAMHAVRRNGAALGEYVAVLGLGLVGQLCVQLLAMNGCYVVGWDLILRRIELAKRVGARAVCHVGKEDPVAASRVFSGGKGLDSGIVAIAGEATSAISALEQSMRITPDGHATGTITVVGGIHLDYKGETTNIDYRRASRTGPGYHDEAWELGADYPEVLIRWSTRTNVELCLRLIAEDRLKVAPMITHSIRLDECEPAIDSLLDDYESALGVVFRMQ